MHTEKEFEEGRMGILKRAALVILVCLGTQSCGSGSGGGSGGSSSETQVTINGAVEKGPFIVGSSVTINVLGERGENTGSTIVTNTVDDLGSFSFSVGPDKLLQITSTGYYKNEITGGLSTGVLTLRSIYRSDSEAEQTAYVNLLTHLTSSRALNLIRTNSLSYDQAVEQSQNEFLSIIEQIIPSSNQSEFTSLSIFDSPDSVGSAYLLAVSSIMYQTAIDLSNLNSSSPNAELALLLNQFEEDFGDDGLLGDTSKIELLKAAQTKINPISLMEILLEWVDEPEGYGVSDINEFLDTDLDGDVNSIDPDDDNDGLLDEEDSEPFLKNFKVANQALATNEDVQLTISLEANNPNGGEITLEIISGPNNGTLVGDYPELTYNPNANYSGIDSFSYTLAQAELTSQVVDITITVHPINDEPVISGTPSTSIKASYEYSFTPTVLNVDEDDLFFSVENLPSWASFDVATGKVSGTPSNEDFGPYPNISISVTDGMATVSLESFSIEVLLNPWVTQPDMPTGRHSPTATLVGDQAYVMGGFNDDVVTPENSGIISTVEVFNLSTRTWHSADPMPTKRGSHTANALGNEIILMGGVGELGGADSLSSVESYNTATQVWSTKASMNTPRGYHASCVYDDKIFVFGGRNVWTKLNSVEMYDPNTDTWAEKSSNDKLGDGVSCVTLGSEIYVFGGSNNENGYLVYDPTADSWVSSGSTLSSKRYGSSEVAVDGKIYVFGTFSCTENCIVEVFDPFDSSWIEKSQLPIPKHSMGTVYYEGKVFTFGGRNSSINNMNLVESYDPSID